MTSPGGTTVATKGKKGGKAVQSGSPGGAAPPPERRPAPRGFLTQYKPEQGKATRTGSFIAAGLLIAWGAWFLRERLAGYQGDEAWRLLITPGIPILVFVVLLALAWRVTFVNRGPSDFMIATEGEMKKVNWSSKKEVIGSTKVVIMFTIFLAVLLFVVDLAFKYLFSALGVLKMAE
jgi:preprotein translocase SecE subunit